jgi:hypothetical protein
LLPFSRPRLAASSEPRQEMTLCERDSGKAFFCLSVLPPPPNISPLLLLLASSHSSLLPASLAAPTAAFSPPRMQMNFRLPSRMLPRSGGGGIFSDFLPYSTVEKRKNIPSTQQTFTHKEKHHLHISQPSSPQAKNRRASLFPPFDRSAILLEETWPLNPANVRGLSFLQPRRMILGNPNQLTPVLSRRQLTLGHPRQPPGELPSCEDFPPSTSSAEEPHKLCKL